MHADGYQESDPAPATRKVSTSYPPCQGDLGRERPFLGVTRSSYFNKKAILCNQDLW